MRGGAPFQSAMRKRNCSSMDNEFFTVAEAVREIHSENLSRKDKMDLNITK